MNEPQVTDSDPRQFLVMPRTKPPHFFEGLFPRPLPDVLPALLGPFLGLLDFFAILITSSIASSKTKGSTNLQSGR